jgi:haloalkane dehalogenase
MTDTIHTPDAIRTPDEILDNLPDFPYQPHFREFQGLRLAHIDEGDGPPVIFFHGEPTWSFLWRKVMPPVLEAGYRCIAPDLPGFGRSDKPVDVGWYSYDRHTEAMAQLLTALDVRDATVVVHDWGGPVGLRLAAEFPDQIARMVILDTGLFTGRQKMSDAWQTFRDFVERTEDLPIGFLVKGGCKRDPGEEVVAAYDAPFPNPESKAGARAFPLLIPSSPDQPGAAAGQRVLEALQGDGRPKVVLWADSDPVIPLDVGRRFAQALGTDVEHVIADAGHFLQEDAGPEIGRLIADWLGRGS